jgi:DNA-binding IclR family transcriptional regulator
MRTRTDPKLIKAEIAKVRKRGYTISNQDLFDYVVAIGVPLFNSAGVFVGSLSVGGVAQRYDKALSLLGLQAWMLFGEAGHA